jgi:hypothetical protein
MRHGHCMMLACIFRFRNVSNNGTGIAACCSYSKIACRALSFT